MKYLLILIVLLVVSCYTGVPGMSGSSNGGVEAFCVVSGNVVTCY